jgi:hypothetical protein
LVGEDGSREATTITLISPAPSAVRIALEHPLTRPSGFLAGFEAFDRPVTSSPQYGIDPFYC